MHNILLVEIICFSKKETPYFAEEKELFMNVLFSRTYRCRKNATLWPNSSKTKEMAEKELFSVEKFPKTVTKKTRKECRHTSSPVEAKIVRFFFISLLVFPPRIFLLPEMMKWDLAYICMLA